MYDLKSEGLLDIRAIIEINKVSRDPLSGVMDNANRLFFTTYSPILSSGSIIVYEGYEELAADEFAVDYETGEIVVTDPPADQLRATYLLCEYTNTRLVRFLIQGFRDMESLVKRGWRLSSGSDAYASATEDSGTIYVVGSSGVTDPATGRTTFSESWLHRGFFLACTEVAIGFGKMDMAARGFMWREDRGITVDKSKMAVGRAAALEFAMKRREAYLQAVLDEVHGLGRYGGYVSSPVTADYAYDFEWQTKSKDYDYRNTLLGWT